MMCLSRYALAGALSLVAMPALAQLEAPGCGGLGAEGEWIGGAAGASDPGLSAGAFTLTGRAVPQDGRVVALFALSQAGDVRLEARTALPGGDPVIELYDAAGTMIVTDDDSGGGLDSRAETSLEAGSYCLAVRGYAGSALDADIRVGRLEHEALTEGLRGGFFDPAGAGGPSFVGIQPCTPETQAVELWQGPLDAALAQGGADATDTVTGTPYYRFTLQEPRSLSIRAMNPAADPYIYLFDGDGNLIDENDDYDSLDSRIDLMDPLPAGTYCVGMRALSDPGLPVTLRIVPFDTAHALAERIATGDAAPPLDGSWPVTRMGALPPVAVRDLFVSGTRAHWLSFEIAAPTVLVIDAVEVREADPLIILYDAGGTEIAFNDDANGTLNSQILARLEPGRYLLAVRQYSDEYEGTIRLVTERFVRASE